jgi:hypothetical protein
MSIVLLTEPFSGGGSGSGTVTSIDVVGGTTGLTTSGGPVTTAGVITLSGTLGIANGGTGTATPSLVAGTNVTITGVWPNQTINSSGGGGSGSPAGSNQQVQYNNAGAFGASANFTYDGYTLYVGGGTFPSGLVNPVASFAQSSPGYIQAYVHNDNIGTTASSDFIVYPDNGTDASCWGDFGVTSSTFADATFTVTGPNETYLFASGSSGKTGNLVYATDSNGTANAHQWYVGGFTQAKGAWKMQLTSTGLQLASALAVSYGGTGATTLTGLVKGNGTSAFTAATAGTDYQAPITLTTTGSTGAATFVGNVLNIPQYVGSGGSGTVTSVSVVNANGFSGSVATATTTPAITITTGVSGLLKGNGTAVSAASSGTDYAPGTSALATGILKSATSTGVLSIAVAGDFPTLNQNTTGTADNVTGTVAIANGGTGQTTASAAFNALSPITTTGDIIIGNGTNSSGRLAIGSNTYVLTSNGTTATWAAPTGGSGTPGGSTTQIQFNNAGAFGGSSGLTWDGTNVLIGSTGAIRLGSSGATYLAFKAPTSVASNVTWTLPSTDGTSGQVLQTSGTGTLSWVSQSGGGGGSPNLDGGIPSSNYGGITAIDGGTP